jgi:glycine/sarcosine N-methyltransferase
LSCYDELAADYHLIFADWDASIARQAAAIGPLLERECGGGGLRILDCACGIGTQSLGLAQRGHRITGCDASRPAIERARAEAGGRGLELSLSVADMRDLTGVAEGDYDAVICLDNALPHLESESDLRQAARQIRRKLRAGGVFLASIRDYDQAAGEKPVVLGPQFYRDGERRRIVHQVWDWMDERRYTFHLYITLEEPDGWVSRHYAATYRAVLREELRVVLEASGYTGVRWLMPEKSGFYQPLVLAKAGAAS